MAKEKDNAVVARPASIARVERGHDGRVIVAYVTADGMAGLVLSEDDAIKAGVSLLQAAAADEDDPLAFPADVVTGGLSHLGALVLSFRIGGKWLPITLNENMVEALRSVIAQYDISASMPSTNMH